MRKVYLFKLVALFFTVNVFNGLSAQNFHLVKDINAVKSSNPANPTEYGNAYAVANGNAFFTADDGIHGTELWKSDGTAVGTALVKDIYPGIGDSYITAIFPFNNKVYFFATNNYYVQELWVSDGTSAGTQILKDSFPINYYSNNSQLYPPQFAIVGNFLYFTLSNITSYDELWKTDGTSNNTQLVSNFYTQAKNYDYGISNLTSYHGLLYFSTQTSSFLWYTDGTASGTNTLNYKANFFGGINVVAVVNGKLYFVQSSQLFQSDGSSAGTNAIGVYPNDGLTINSLLAVLDNNLLFIGQEGGSGEEIFEYNTAGSDTMKLLSKLDSGINNIITVIPGTINNSLIFFVNTGTDGNMELWATNGIYGGTINLKTNTNSQVNPYSGAVIKNKLYFTNYNDTTGSELWVSDGTLKGTQIFKDINPGVFGSQPSAITQFSSTILFSANDGVTGNELWKTDGTTAGTILVKDINVSATSSSNNGSIFGFKTSNNFVFRADDGKHGTELWTTNGNASNTGLLNDFYPGTLSGIFNDFDSTTFNGLKYFFASSKESNYGIWKTDGTAAGTSFVTDVITSNRNIPGGIRSTDSDLFYSTIDRDSLSTSGIHYSQLWAYNGTSTVLLKNDFPNNSAMQAVGKQLYFFQSSSSGNLQLWASDGTLKGTTLVNDIYPAGTAGVLNGTYAAYATSYNGELYFVAGPVYSLSSGQFNFYLWKSDGTSAGTAIVKNLPLTSPFTIVELGKKLYFTAQDSATGPELWVSDGSATGTQLVKDIYPGANGSGPNSLTVIDSTLYFIANDGANGNALWKTKGTDNSTVMIKNVSGSLVNGNGTLYFIYNNQIWQSDGTTDGTKVISDDGSLDGVQNLSYIVSAGNNIYFTGYTYALGYELYTGRAGTLPVTLLSFTAQLKGNDALLNWVTINEQDNSYFNVQRSLDGVHFGTVGKVNAQNGVTEKNYYNYDDVNAALLNTGKLYYRLQQVDMDGKITYSGIVVLNLPVDIQVTIGPNPAEKVANIYSSVNISGALITVTDIGGHQLYATKENLQAGSSFALDLSRYTAGTYIVDIQSPAVQKQFKLVKK